MPEHLSVPQHRRDRATHEKARSLRAGELRWVRVYTDDLDELAGESVTVRFLDTAIVQLASKRGWTLPYDHRRIAARLELRATDAAKAIRRLLHLSRLELVHVTDDLAASGNLQIGLDLRPLPQGVETKSVSSHDTVSTHVSVESQHGHDTVTTDVSAQVADSLRSVDPQPGHQTRAEAEKKEHVPSNGNAASYAAAANAVESNEIVNRIIALVARGRPQSIAAIQYEAAGLPDHLLARALESYRGRHPRPTNGGGYIVATLRSLRAEAGIPDTRPRIEREPDL